MPSLTFTAATPKPRRAHANADLYKIAVEAFDDHQRLMTEIDRAVEVHRTITVRVRNGREWIERHDETHPRYERNCELLSRLQSEQEGAAWRVRDLQVARMGKALDMWTAFDALSEIEQAAMRSEREVHKVLKPNRKRYEEMITNWQDMGQEVEVPW